MSIFYKVTTPDGNINYLFGTLHSHQGEFCYLPKEVKLALEFSRCVLTEVNINDLSREYVVEKFNHWVAQYVDSQIALMSDKLSAEAEYMKDANDYILLQRMIHQNNQSDVSLDDICRVPPIYVANSISHDNTLQDVTVRGSLDELIAARAKKNNSFYLEELDDQINALGFGLSYDEQLEYYHVVREHLQAYPESLNELAHTEEAYLAEDLDALKPSIGQNSSPVVQKYLSIFIHQRDRQMVTRMMPQFQEGGAFVAVGALHLQGIVHHLTTHKCQIEPILLSERIYHASLNLEDVFLVACEKGDLDTVTKCFAHDPKFADRTLENGYNLFHLACQHGRLDVALFLLDNNPSLLNRCANDGYTAVHLACQNGHLNVVQALFEKHADFSIRENSISQTPLHSACQFGRQEVILFLLNQLPRSMIDQQTNNGHTPFQFLCYFSTHAVTKKEVFELFIGKGASLTHKDKEGKTAYAIASERNNKAALMAISKQHTTQHSKNPNCFFDNKPSVSTVNEAPHEAILRKNNR